jgi:hypothetical protein
MQSAADKESSQPDGRFKVGCPDGDVTVADKRVDRFQCLLRPVPAAEWAGLGWFLRSQGSSGEEELSRGARWISTVFMEGLNKLSSDGKQRCVFELIQRLIASTGLNPT